MDNEKKVEELCRKWVAWNRKEITGDDFAAAFSKIFKKETMAEWNNPLRKLLVG